MTSTSTSFYIKNDKPKMTQIVEFFDEIKEERKKIKVDLGN